MSYKRAIEAPDFVVDDTQGAMLNTNNKALSIYKTKRDHRAKLVGDHDRIVKLESSMSNIESMLAKLLEKNA